MPRSAPSIHTSLAAAMLAISGSLLELDRLNGSGWYRMCCILHQMDFVFHSLDDAARQEWATLLVSFLKKEPDPDCQHFIIAKMEILWITAENPRKTFADVSKELDKLEQSTSTCWSVRRALGHLQARCWMRMDRMEGPVGFETQWIRRYEML